ncbi:hypothetical protein K4S73_06115 [Staphylococcus epidermidis]|nr:hypothetical protein [Staphylococcus epidermidis]MCG1226654.1 hypothetical protein [Staphylococcus epidermidis]MCG1296281.1 hypothetical protein [Staphylococcus epidermidis]MCG1476790.1 hypothetical protein [Staphylococcus epidermidis]MCG1511321.1 hypothetical protein [Staphylococcus epidermidis]MCG1520770.1 hypothetical protein [Staphylococcus epidermidis]
MPVTSNKIYRTLQVQGVSVLLEFKKRVTKLVTLLLRYYTGLLESSYVTNGQFKGAMLKAGFDVKDKTQLNWHFNVSEKSIKELDKR